MVVQIINANSVYAWQQQQSDQWTFGLQVQEILCSSGVFHLSHSQNLKYIGIGKPQDLSAYTQLKSDII